MLCRPERPTEHADPSLFLSPPQKTSHVLPFLGHVAIEKLTCGSHKHPQDYARILVNGAAQPLPRKDLADGPGESCRMDRFTEYVRERMEMFGDFEGACKKAE